MKKARLYVRAALKSEDGIKISGASQPNYNVMTQNMTPLPTVHFAIDIEIPDSAFERAERAIATIEIPEDALKAAVEIAA